MPFVLLLDDCDFSACEFPRLDFLFHSSSPLPCNAGVTTPNPLSPDAEPLVLLSCDVRSPHVLSPQTQPFGYIPALMLKLLAGYNIYNPFNHGAYK